MKSYFCYIHVAGRLTPELRTFTAADPAELPDMVLAALPQMPTLDRIERIELCTAENELIATISPSEDHPRSH